MVTTPYLASLKHDADSEHRRHLADVLNLVSVAAIQWDRRLWGGAGTPPDWAEWNEHPGYITMSVGYEDLLEALTAASELAGYWHTRIPKLSALWALTADEISADLVARLAGPDERF